MNIATQQAGLSGLARKMVRRNLLSEAAAMEATQNAREENRSFYLQAIEQNLIPVNAALAIASEEFGVPFMNIESLNTEVAPLKAVSESVMEKHQVLPIHQRGEKLFIAVGDPGNQAGLDEVKFSTSTNISPILVDPRKLARLIDTIAGHDAQFSLSDIDEENLDDIDLAEEEDIPGDVNDQQIDTPIVRFVNKVLQDALRRGASDIHFEPYEKVTRIRLRIDGMLHDTSSPPKAFLHKMVARIKILSQLDIAERRLPQDGRMKLAFSKKRTVDFRVNTMPTVHGEKVVIRVLDTSAANLSIETLGMDDSDLKMYQKMAHQPHGMILVTGPTGSGKTVTLYSALGVLNKPERNISSVEDPVEIHVDGINQVNINEKAGLGFATVLRAFLRQDPDVLMVGEIRDLETAEIAIKAAQTGHMVLSTLHTNDASSALARLANMGIAPFNIASSVSLVIAQRLVRRLCEACRGLRTYPEEALLQAGFDKSQLSDLKIYEAVGCNSCSGGYRGRAGIFEVMPVTEDIASIVIAGGSVSDIEQQARAAGIKSMRQSGLDRVGQGITTLEEIERVTTD